MLDGETEDLELFAECSEFIKDDQVRSAFWYMIGIATCSRKYQCDLRWKGDVRDFRFVDSSGDQPFSFITNQKWLLFYFRPPAIRSNKYSKDEISKLFDSCAENSSGEWTVKIRDIADVDRLIAHLGWLN